MTVLTLRRYFDDLNVAAPATPTAARDDRGQSAGPRSTRRRGDLQSVAPLRRAVLPRSCVAPVITSLAWLRGLFAGRWVGQPPSRRSRRPALTFGVPAGSWSRQSAGTPMPSMRDGLEALARVNAAVRADQLIAGRSGPQGRLRPT